MTDLSPELKGFLSQSLLGRLRLRLYREITNSANVFPDEKLMRRFVIRHYRENALVGKLFLTLLTLNTNYALEYSELPELDDVQKLLFELEKNPIRKPVFVEVMNVPAENPSILGIWIHCEELVGGGLVYEIAIIDESHFPETLSYMEIRASQEHPHPMFSLLENNGFVIYDLNDFNEEISLVLRSLKHVQLKRRQPFVQLPALKDYQTLSDNKKWEPPLDPKCDYLLGLVLQGQMSCHEADISLSIVSPYDVDFCFSIPDKPINFVSDLIESGQLPKLLVYWDNISKFILSDDYVAYLAYRKLGFTIVPAVILGDFRDAKVILRKSGGAELLPPVTVGPGENLSSLPDFVKEWLIDRKLASKRLASPQLLDMYSIIMQLSTLVQSPNTNERQLHEFLKANPIALDSYGCYMLSEVRLGDKYRIDLILQYNSSDRRILLIELERSNISLFTKSGRPREKITHAIQQVEDWLRWWQENPTRLPYDLDGSIHPDGLVVVGRSHDLDADSKKRLLHLNHNRRVKVITYDDLLERLADLIENIEAMQ